MYIEPWGTDTLVSGEGPFFVRIPIYATCDVYDAMDSIVVFTIPLCYTHSHPSLYCSVSSYWNTTSILSIFPDFDRSIFRHIVEGSDTLHRNRMADMGADFSGREWDSIFLNIQSDSSWYHYYQYPPGIPDSAFVAPHFWFAMIASGSEDQYWWESNRVLLTTLTLKLEDIMTVCLDTCWWPYPSHLEWIPERSFGKIPRPGMGDPNSFEVCFSIRRADFICGDANGNGVVDVSDVVYLISYLFIGGDPPVPMQAGDVNLDGVVDSADVVYLINYLFKGGPPPCNP
jgi:hypothetical protein